MYTKKLGGCPYSRILFVLSTNVWGWVSNSLSNLSTESMKTIKEIGLVIKYCFHYKMGKTSLIQFIQYILFNSFIIGPGIFLITSCHNILCMFSYIFYLNINFAITYISKFYIVGDNQFKHGQFYTILINQ